MTLLQELRAMVPQRRLTMGEAFVVAEHQAIRFLSIAHIADPPFPTMAITDLRFVKVAQRRPMKSSGATKWIKPRWFVLLNATEPLVRQRFSLGHELKHILDHPFADTLYGDRTDPFVVKRVERVCDYFSACLLMPRTWMKRAFAGGIQDLTQLAEVFDVSESAMELRLRSVGLVEQVERCGTIPDTYLRSSSLKVDAVTIATPGVAA
jgi:Zn-dependent peptidase ImmA (M78 family)